MYTCSCKWGRVGEGALNKTGQGSVWLKMAEGCNVNTTVMDEVAEAEVRTENTGMKRGGNKGSTRIKRAMRNTVTKNKARKSMKKRKSTRQQLGREEWMRERGCARPSGWCTKKQEKKELHDENWDTTSAQSREGGQRLTKQFVAT